LSRPFDAKRYKRLLEGLDAAEIKLSALERTKRVDAEFFSKRHLRVSALLHRARTEDVAALADISDGNHFSIADQFVDEDGIPYYRGQDGVGHPFIEQSSPRLISQKAYSQPYMTRSHLRKGDVLLTIVGTIGESALVTSDEPATCSCKLAILRPHGVLPGYLAAFLRSEIGRSQTERYTRGAVQMGLPLEDMDQICVARLSRDAETRVAQAVEDARVQFDAASQELARAEATLAAALGLADWQPPQPLNYTRRASQAFAAERLDAEYFREAYIAARNALERAGAVKFLPLEQLLSSLTNGHTPLRHDLTIGEVPFLCAEHVSDFELRYDSDKRILNVHHRTELARTRVKDGDVLLSIKGRVGNFALAENVPGDVNINQDVALLRFKDTLPIWWALAFLNSPFGKLQVQQHCTGGINPFLGLGNVRKLLVPVFEEDLMVRVGEQTRERVQAARAARHRARELLAAAQRAVEIAIEQDEAAALAYLDGFDIAP
jgi:type I restriction enzyme M protein